MIPGNLTPEARAAKNAYQREYRKNNPDRIRLHNKAYWERKAQQAAERTEDETLTRQIEQLHQKGFSLTEIAQHFTISHMKVSRILKEIKSNK